MLYSIISFQTMDIQNKLYEAGLLRDNEAAVMIVDNCLLTQYATPKGYGYRVYNIYDLKSRFLFSRQNPLPKDMYNQTADKILQSRVNYLPEDAKPSTKNERAKTLLSYIFTNILPKHGMTFRDKQYELAMEILQGLQDNKLMLCEAEVGTGKTHAYILAVTVHNLFSDTKTPTVISTSTIALQKALTEEYIPQISDILTEHKIIDKPLSFVVRKGKSHYVCDDRLKTYRSSIQNNKRDEEQGLLNHLIELSAGRVIDLDGRPLTPYVKDRICVSDCGGNCAHSELCRFMGFTNQRDLLHRYLSGKPEFKDSRVIELCDDGYSGTNFRRPAMTELLEKAKAKEISCVIVKDFSRFGREYIEVSDYIDQIFPFLGIRFISVNDGYDSALANGATSGVDVAFRNIIYSYYSRDLSEKVKSAKRTKALKGDYLSPYAPIGYRKSESDKNKLVIDEESAGVVKRIFRMAGMGMKIAQIAKILNAENVPTPRESKNKQGIYHPWPAVSDNYIWYESIVGRILRDERYLGKVVYGKRYRPEVGNGKTLKSGKANWIVVEEKHEPLVSIEGFMAAQAAMAEFVEVDTPGYGNHLLSGKVKCGVCGYSLARTKIPTPRYSCVTRQKAKECGCMRGHIKESELAEILLYAIRVYAVVMLDEQKMAKAAIRKNEPLNLRKQIAEYQTAVKKMEEQRAALYDDYAEEKIDRESYLKGRDHLTVRQEEMECCIKGLQVELTKAEAITDPGRPQESSLKQYLKADMLTRKMVVELVANICVYTDRSIKINWRFD